MLPQALRSLFGKPSTIRYPYEKEKMPASFRAKLVFEPEKCIGCKLCMKDCPSNAIEIVKVGEKQFKAVVRLDKCIYCGQCVESCRKDALHCTPDFELAAFDRDKLKVDI
jgi:formate hydrogenlyase subunit 6/NADH:ubiquinone oxidoreductase subunit I